MKHTSIALALFTLIIGLFFLIFNQSATAQSALDGFNPNANATIRAFVVQADGKILIGGEFTVVQGVTRNRIARLNPDGTLDTGFDPNANNFVFGLAVQSDGKILAGGLFTSVSPNGGAATTRNRIARFNADGTLDTTFDPNLNDFIFSIVVQPDGKILTGGNFTSVSPNGGAAVTRNHIARFNTNGTLDTMFDPNVSNEIYSIAVQTDGRILIVGNFSSITPNGGTGFIRFRIARLNADGTFDTTFNSGANQGVYAVAVQSDDKILVGGQFTSISPNGGTATARNRIARLNTDGSVDTAFDPNANNTVLSIVIQPDGKILAGGNFTGFSPNGGSAVTRNNIARINLDGTLDTLFNPNASGQVDSMAVQPDGKILLGGIFTTVGGQSRNRIARLERNGLLDQTINPNANNIVNAIALQTDGRILIGGDFTTISGTARNRIARCAADGTLETGFNPNVNGIIYAIALQSDGKILIGGDFTNVGGTTRNYIVRLNADGTLDTSFNPNANDSVRAFAVQLDGKVVIVGDFTTISGTTRNYIARLNLDGSLDTTFDPNANSFIYTLILQSDGRILIGGEFSVIGGTSRNFIARLNSDGTIDTAFNPNTDGGVFAIAAQSDGKILIGGSFLNVGSTSRIRIARLNADGSPDIGFDPGASNGIYSIVAQSDGHIIVGGVFTVIGGQVRNNIARLNINGSPDSSFNPNPNNTVRSIALQSDGKILVGGQFNSIGGEIRNNIARLSNNTAALSTLDINQTTLILTRDGSAPQFTRVIFEQSIDNGANWALLGTAVNSFASLVGIREDDNNEPSFAPQASDYILTGQNISTGQNSLIRARGFYRTGYFNGSETTEDKVQNVFLLAPTAASVSVSGKAVTIGGRSIANARVSITLPNGEVRSILTNLFGNYRFENLSVGQTYILSITTNRYTFINPMRVISLNGELVGEDFVSDGD